MPSSNPKKSKETDFYITNRNSRLKREIVSIAKSEGKTYSQFCREKLISIAASYPERARQYQEEDDGC